MHNLIHFVAILCVKLTTNTKRAIEKNQKRMIMKLKNSNTSKWKFLNRVIVSWGFEEISNLIIRMLYFYVFTLTMSNLVNEHNIKLKRHTRKIIRDMIFIIFLHRYFLTYPFTYIGDKAKKLKMKYDAVLLIFVKHVI